MGAPRLVTAQDRSLEQVQLRAASGFCQPQARLLPGYTSSTGNSRSCVHMFFSHLWHPEITNSFSNIARVMVCKFDKLSVLIFLDLANCRFAHLFLQIMLPYYICKFCRILFYRTRVRSLAMLVTNTLTHRLPNSRLVNLMPVNYDALFILVTH